MSKGGKDWSKFLDLFHLVNKKEISAEEISVKQLIQAIRKLPSDEVQTHPGKWYKTQKEHWLGWLSEYDGAGAYGRKIDVKRNAKFAYNHIVEYRMLLWIIQAAGVRENLIQSAQTACDEAKTMQQKSSAIRKHVTWEELAATIWKDK